MSEISKAYEPQSVEDKWYDFWLKKGCFTADPARVTDKRPAYSIVIPPPNVTGMLHMGHVLNNTIQDILARKARMDGKEVLWLPGTDHAGIATQVQVEKALKKEERLTKYDLGRERFLERVWQWKEKHGGIIIQQLKKLGCSCDWTRERFTMDPEYSRCVRMVFVELYKKGLIYRGKRMVNWCPATQTALSDEEVEMKSQKGFMYQFKVEVVEQASSLFSRASGVAGQAQNHGRDVRESNRQDACSTTWLTIATTRPETIPGDTAVAVNPKDPRYAHLIGKHIVRPLPAELPREQKLIPIIGDEHVDFEFGTGVLKVTPAHDKADFDIGQRHRLPIVDIMNPDATMNDFAGADLKGLDRFKARKVATEKLRELGALVDEKPYENNVGFSQRADVPIEPRLSEQWFLKYPAVEQSKACVEQRSVLGKQVRVVVATGEELRGASIKELRHAATAFAKGNGIIGGSFKNEDSGIEIRVGRQSLTHAFSNLGVANIKAVVVLPQLVQNAIWLSSAPHDPPNPMFKQVHRFIAALSLGGELHQVLITAKEFWDGTILYDHKAKKITLGGKSLEAHPLAGKLDTQPAPSAEVTVGDLLEGVNAPKMRFHPDRWAKVYDHWLTNIQDWCISRQLWWGHRIPVWTITLEGSAWRNNFLLKFAVEKFCLATNRMPPDGVREFDEPPVPNPLTNGMFESGGQGNCRTLWHMQETERPGVFEFRALSDASAKYSEIVATELSSMGFTQDPDVLDTWFSSWLWPFATMGWTGDKSQDSNNPTLQAFYPTTDLVTGPDIIFFWVARMIMAGYEFMGELPFRNVYFTGIIRDKQGRKMSKTLGNSPDPLELIAKYGADALRFGTMRSAPLGQDVLFDEKDVELGRNFCNKLWNACRFRQMQGSAAASAASEDASSEQFPVQGEIDPRLLTTDDKWILLKLDQAIREITTAFAEYKFNEATATLYRFFWSEYCDWYVEASKAVLSVGASERQSVEASGRESANGTDAPTLARADAPTAAARRANTLAVIDFVLSHTLRLFHPFLPFITEELWHGMGYSEDMPENQGGRTIMNAPWPKPFDEDFKGHYGLDDCYLEMADAKYGLVTEGRNLRRAANIPANKKVTFILKPAEHVSTHDIEVLRLLLNAEALQLNPDYQPKKATPTVRAKLGDLYLPLEGLVDTAAEIARLTKEKEKHESEIVKVEQKLNNPNFTQKVPPNVLQEHQQRLADWQAKLEHTKSALEALRS